MSAEKRPGSVQSAPSAKIKLIRAALLAATALSGLGAGAALARPVLSGAQVQEARFGADSDGGRFGNRYEDRRFSRDSLRRFHERVEWAQSRGALNRAEADRLHFRANALDDLARAMARRDGLDYYEREELDDRFADLRAQFRRMVWDRDYRGAYRDEWRNSRDNEERFWRDDDRSDVATRNDFAARDSSAAPDLKGRDDDWQPPELGKTPAARQAVIPPPQPYRSDQPIPPATRKPSPSQRSASPPSAQPDEQPFKDGRDFH